jgi:hypothetical protein
MNEYTDRLERGVQWEVALSHKLERWGWAVAPFGVATLPGVVSLGRVREGGPPPGALYQALLNYRDHKGQPSGLRWLPDMIAARGPMLCLIDAKSGRHDTGNYAIEYRALMVGRVLELEFRTPVFYVWDDGGVLTPQVIVLNYPQIKVCMPEDNDPFVRGSREPFVLVSKRFALPANEVFRRGVEDAAT